MGVLELGSRVGSTLLLTRDRGGGLRNSSGTLSQVLLMYYNLVILIFPHPGRVAQLVVSLAVPAASNLSHNSITRANSILAPVSAGNLLPPWLWRANCTMDIKIHSQ